MSNRCRRCGYEWTPKSKDPVRCPSCKSTRWDRASVRNQCLRCGAEWMQRGDSPPKYCPVCHSSMWDSERTVYTCPKCGLTRTLRSNSRMDLCPVCDRYADPKPRDHFDDPRLKKAGVSEISRIWTDGEGMTLMYVDDGRLTAYLYAAGDLVGSVNLSGWCRDNRLSLDYVLRNYQDDSVSEKLYKLAMSILSEDEISSGRIPAGAETQGMNEEQALIVSMHEGGMEPLPISMKLGIPFSAVMDVLNGRSPASADSTSGETEGENPEQGNGRT